jgi:hypothetical protein
LIALAGILLMSCAPPVERPRGPAAAYDDAKDMFKRGRFDRSLDFTDALSSASPPNSYTERARVLRAVIYTGELRSLKELGEAYAQGVDKTKNTQFKAEYRRLQNDNLQAAARAALNLAETAHQLAPDGVISKELTLEASFPTTQGPVEVQELARVKNGAWLEPEGPSSQESAAADSLRKGIDDALADAVSGDRPKAISALAGGSTKIEGVDFALFLSKGLVDGATIFDRKHERDSQKLKTLCNEGNETLKAASALLKEKPDADKDKALKKIQDQFKTILKKG